MNENELTHTEQAMAYYGDELSPEEKVAFEAHLAGCAECQALLADARKYLPAAEAALAFKPKYTVEEQVQRFDAKAQAQRSTRRIVRYALAAGIAAVLGIAALQVLKNGRRSDPHAAPVTQPP